MAIYLKKAISIPPNRIRCISERNTSGIPIAFAVSSFIEYHHSGTYLVFHRFCAAFTLALAVSAVKGGRMCAIVSSLLVGAICARVRNSMGGSLMGTDEGSRSLPELFIMIRLPPEWVSESGWGPGEVG
jgi:hypothetical protein